MPDPDETGLGDQGDAMRKMCAEQAPSFLAHHLPGLDAGRVRYVPHQVAHAASAGLAAPRRGGPPPRGPLHRRRAARAGQPGAAALPRTAPRGPDRAPRLPPQLRRVQGHGDGLPRKPRFALDLEQSIHATGDGGFRTERIDFAEFAPRLAKGDEWTEAHADLAASIQLRLDETLLDLVRWLHGRTGDSVLTLAGGVALNCVANSRIYAEGPFDQVWVQPASGDSGTALGGALAVAHDLGDATAPMPGADLGRGWTDEEIEAWLTTAAIGYEHPHDVADAVAEVLAGNGIVAWFRAAASTGRARSDTGRCWPIPATSPIWSG